MGAKAAGCRRGAAGRRSGGGGPQWASPHLLTGCGGASLRRSSGPSAAPGEGVATPLVVPKAGQHSLPTPEELHIYSPPTILLIVSSAPGMMRAAAGGPAVPSRSRPARAGEGVGCPACSRDSRAARRGARGRVRSGRGRPGAPRRPSPLLRLERFQSRGAAPLCSALAQRSSSSSSSSSSCSSFSCRCPRQPLGQPAPPLPPSPCSCALPANFPEPRPAAQSSGGLRGPLQTAGCARLCLVPHPGAPGALRRLHSDARGRGPRRSPGEVAGRWAFG